MDDQASYIALYLHPASSQTNSQNNPSVGWLFPSPSTFCWDEVIANVKNFSRHEENCYINYYYQAEGEGDLSRIFRANFQSQLPTFTFQPYLLSVHLFLTHPTDEFFSSGFKNAKNRLAVGFAALRPEQDPFYSIPSENFTNRSMSIDQTHITTLRAIEHYLLTEITDDQPGQVLPPVLKNRL